MRVQLHKAVAGLLVTVTPVFAEPTAGSLPPIKTVEFDPQSGFRVNGQPFFPVLLYDAPTDDETLAQLREFGFNVLTCKPEICDSLPAQGFYGAIHVGKSKATDSL